MMFPDGRFTPWKRSAARALAVVLVAILAGCGRSPPDPSGKGAFTSRAVSQTQGPVTLRAAVLGDDESERYFGMALADKGIQAVWLSVDNGTEKPLYYLPVTTDINYFTAPEVAQLFHKWRHESNHERDTLLAQETMPDVVAPHQAASGFVLTHREGGLKFLRAEFLGPGAAFDFRFVIPIGGRTYAAQRVDFGNLQSQGDVTDPGELRARIEALPCCTANKAGDRSGDPLNLVIVGSGANAIFPFIERGWRLDEPFDVHSALRSVKAFLFRSEYMTAPVSPLYVFGRGQDVALQKARSIISLRNHLRVWQAPFTYQGQHVWVGQISRDIGVKLTTQVWYLTTHRISPDVDQDRYYLLQDLLLSAEMARFGFARGVGVSTRDNPRVNLTHDPYVTDGLRLVVFLNAGKRPVTDVEFIDWERPAAL